MNSTKTLIKIYSTNTTRTHYIRVNNRERAYDKMNELIDDFTAKGIDFIRMKTFVIYVD